MSLDFFIDFGLRLDTLRAKLDLEHPPESVIEIMSLIDEVLVMSEGLPEMIEGLDKVEVFKPLAGLIHRLFAMTRALFEMLQIMLVLETRGSP